MSKLNEKLKYVRIYDSGDKHLDRYTAVYMDRPERQPDMYEARGMSSSPFSPQGFGQYCMAQPGRHLGKRIKFEELPEDCQRLIKQDLAE